MPMPNSDEPIQPEINKQMQCWAEVLDETFNGKDYKTKDRKWGFALLVFPFGQEDKSHRINYISNSQREDMINAMKEFIARDTLIN